MIWKSIRRNSALYFYSKLPKLLFVLAMITDLYYNQNECTKTRMFKMCGFKKIKKLKIL